MMKKKNGAAAVIGIGNLLMRDEGFGVHVIRHLEENFRFPPNVNLVDAGTAGIYMAPIFEDVRRAIVVDVIALDDKPGSIVHLSHEGMVGKSVSTSMSPHQIGVLEVLEICRFRQTLPEIIDFFCVIPETVEVGISLSQTLFPRVAEVASLVVTTLKQEGYPAEDA